MSVTLPGGFAANGGWHREAVLRPLRGADEAYVVELGPGLSGAERVTALLTRALVRLGPYGPVAPEVVRSLTVGDREALLLHLRRLTVGERLQCVVNCPACGEPMDLDLMVRDLLLGPYGWEQEEFWREVWVGEEVYRVRLRLPTGGDQEAAARLAGGPEGVHGASAEMLRCCLLEVDRSESAWPVGLRGAVSKALAEVDPQAELLLELSCPTCEGSSAVPLDAAQYFLGELAQRSRNLYREVHQLALHYHWGESEILAMSSTKRRMYLEFLADQFGREGS